MVEDTKNRAEQVRQFAQEQERLRPYITLQNTFRTSQIQLVAGVDIAYWTTPDGQEMGVCCIVVVDFITKAVIEKVDYHAQISAPYLAGYLALRELPLVVKATEKLTTHPDLFMFDGNGYLHPRHMGIATHASFSLKKPTIGVAKTYFKIAGTTLTEPAEAVGSYTLIQSEKEIYGAVLRTRAQVKPVYVSCGNWIDLPTTIALTLHFVDENSRLPITTRYADIETHTQRKRLQNSVEK